TAYVEDPSSHTLTSVLSLAGPGLLLAGHDTQAHHVSDWERLLAGWCRRPEITRMQLLHRTVPSTARDLWAWWRTQLADTDTFPARVVADVLADVDNRARHPECLLAVTFRPPAGRNRP